MLVLAESDGESGADAAVGTDVKRARVRARTVCAQKTWAK